MSGTDGRPDWDVIEACLDTSRYHISDVDNSGITEYYGFIEKDGKWYIMEVTATTVRYKAGASDYATNWTGRALLVYGYYNVVF